MAEEEEEEVSSESNFSEGDDDDDDKSDSDFDSEADLSEEGLDWEQMERQAEEDDRRAAIKRTGKDVPVRQAPPAKRKPAGGRR